MSKMLVLSFVKSDYLIYLTTLFSMMLILSSTGYKISSIARACRSNFPG